MARGSNVLMWLGCVTLHIEWMHAHCTLFGTLHELHIVVGAQINIIFYWEYCTNSYNKKNTRNLNVNASGKLEEFSINMKVYYLILNILNIFIAYVYLLGLNWYFIIFNWKITNNYFSSSWSSFFNLDRTVLRLVYIVCIYVKVIQVWNILKKNKNC